MQYGSMDLFSGCFERSHLPDRNDLEQVNDTGKSLEGDRDLS